VTDVSNVTHYYAEYLLFSSLVAYLELIYVAYYVELI